MSNIKKYIKIRTISIPPDDNKLGIFGYFSRLIMFIDKIDLSNFSIEIENPVLSQTCIDLRIL